MTNPYVSMTTTPTITSPSVRVTGGVPVLSWTSNVGAARIYRDTQSSGATKTLITTVPAGTTTYTDTNVVGKNTYYYFLAPVLGGVEGTLVPVTLAIGSGLQFWLDAAQLTGLNNGQGLSFWTDRSSNGYVGTATGGPTYQTNQMNGLPVVRFNGTSQYVNYGNVVNLGTNPFYIYAVYKFNSTAAQNAVISKSLYGGAIGRWGIIKDTIYTAGTGFMIDAAGSGGTAAYADSSTSPQMTTGVWDRVTVSAYRNGEFMTSAAVSSTANLTNSSTSLVVGAYPNGSGGFPPQYYSSVDIAEIFVYNETMTTAQRQELEGYLAWKWGLQSSLPANHPHKSAAPTMGVTIPVITNVNVSLVSNVPRVTWTGVSAASTRIYRDFQISGATKALVATVAPGVTTYDDSSATLAATYYYFLVPVSSSGVEGTVTNTITPFSVTQPTGLQFWIDASQLTGLSSGQALSTWVDRSSNAYSGTAVGGPTYQTGQINNLPVVRFNGSSQYVNYGDVLDVGTNPQYVFAVYKHNMVGTSAVIGKSLYGGAVGRWSIVRDGGSTVYIVQAFDGNAVAPGYSDSSTAVQMTTAVWDRSLVSISQNGGAAGSNTGYTSTVDMNTNFLMLVGAYQNGSGGVPPQFYMNGDIAEILVYNAAMADTTRQKIEGYLAWKWGQQSNLPAGHLSKNGVPMDGSVTRSTGGANTPSSAPANVTATVLPTRGIQLGWTNAGFHYKIYRDTQISGATKTLVRTVAGSSYIDTSPMASNYYYFVSAANSTDEGPLSSAVFARQDAALEWIVQNPNANTTPNDQSIRMATDSSGNVIVAQMTLNGLASGGTATGQWEIVLSKYNSSGALQWIKQNSSFQTNDEDAPLGLATDASNNIVMAIYTLKTLSGGVSAGAYEGAVIKFDANGNTLWVLHNTLFNTSGWDNAIRPAIDPSGNIYVGGLVQGAISGGVFAGSDDTYVMKVTPAGQIVWTRQFRSMNTTGSEYMTGIGLDASGNIYVSYNTTGAVSGGISMGSNDVAFAKIDNNGNLVWIKQYAAMNTGYGENSVTGPLIVDSTNQCMYATYLTSGTVSGGANLATNVGDVVVAKLDLNGALVWLKQIPYVINTASAEYGPAIVVDKFGNPIVAYATDGTISGGVTAGGTDIAIAQFDSNGNVLWTYQKQLMNTSGADTLPVIGYDPEGYVVGAYSTTGTVSGGTNRGNADTVVFRVILGSAAANVAPTGVATAIASSGIRVSWTTRGLKYLVYRDTQDSGATKQYLGLTYDAYFDDTTANTNNVYYYFVSSMYGTSESPFGTAVFSASAPAVPSAPTTVAATVGDKQAAVTWVLSADNGRSPILRQTVTSNPGNIQVVVGPSATSATVPGLVNGYEYTFTVTATNAIGTSAPSVPSAAASYTDPAITAAVEAAASSPAAIDTYVASQTTKTAAEVYLELRKPLQAANLGASAETQFIDSIAGKNGSTVLALDSTQSDFVLNSMSQVSPTFVAVKPTTVVLPTFSPETNSASVDVAQLVQATQGETYLQIEIPAGKTITLQDPSSGSKTLSFDGTQFSDGQKTYGLNSTIVIGRRLFKIVAIGSMLLEPQEMGLRGIMLGAQGMRLLGQGFFVMMGAAETTY